MADISVDPWTWSSTAASNSPSGSTNIGTGLDDNLRAIQAAVKSAFDPLSSVSGTNTITATCTGLTAYASGQVFRFTPANTNTGATTLNVTSLGAKNVYFRNAACVGGELIANVPVVVQYDGTQFQILSGSPSLEIGTVQATTSGTSKSFTIPAWAKRITLTLSGVSLNGATELAFQIGDAGGIENTGYLGAALSVGNPNSVAGDNPGGSWRTYSANAGAGYNGIVTITLLDPATFTWGCSGTLFRSDSATTDYFGGSKALSAALTTVQIGSNNGTSTFDAGSVNVLFE